jgi:hypothetical protein
MGDAQVFADRLDIVDQRLSRVEFERGQRIGNERSAAATAALVDSDNEVTLGVIATPVSTGTETAAGPSVQVQRWSSPRVARRFPIDLVARADRQMPRLKRLDRRMHSSRG